MTRVSPFNGHTLTVGALACALALSPTLRGHAAGSQLQLESGRVTLSGTSNVHPYEASTSTVKVMRVQVSPTIVADSLDALVTPGAIEAFAISIPAATLTSPREGLDKNLQKALKVQQYPDITFALARLEAGPAPNRFRGIGKLTIAGVDREVTLDLTIQKAGATLNVKGTLSLLMTDYGITPPKAMLGMLKTDPKVTVAFETALSIPTT
jgi:hypothetical protein